MDSKDKEIKALSAKPDALLAAVKLLDRAPDPEYIKKWTSLIAVSTEKPEVDGTAVVIFKLGNQWLAISATAFCQVITTRRVHSIPKRTKQGLLGVVNFQGRLTLCIDMHEYLGIGSSLSDTQKANKLRFTNCTRMVAIQDKSELWIFHADEIYGVYRCDLNKIKNVPGNFFNSPKNFLKGIFEWEGHNVGLLDEELLFFSLRRSLE